MDERKRVFILGAGASKHVTRKTSLPIPLAREFFKSNYVNELWPNNHLKWASFSNTELIKFIEAFFNAKYKTRFSPKQYHVDIDENINIEEVFSFLEFIESGDYYFNTEIFKIKKAKFELLEYLFNSLVHFHLQDYDTELYSKILRSIGDNGSIITYNWDCLIENFLAKKKAGQQILKSLDKVLNPYSTLNEGYYDDVAFNDYHKAYFLKLHGSINWFHCRNKSCIRHNIPAIFDFRQDIFSLLWTCDYCGSSMEMMILPPHVHKTYRLNRFFSLQAKIASQKLSNADEIIIIGYSFPDFDFEANALFKRSVIEYDDTSWFKSRKKIVVVNPAVNSPDYIDKIKSLFSINERSKYSSDLELFNSVEGFIGRYDW